MSHQRLTKLSVVTALAVCPSLSMAQEVWSAREGTVTVRFSYEALESHGLWVSGLTVPAAPGDSVMTLALTLDESMDLGFTVDVYGRARLSNRILRVLEGITIGTSDAEQSVFDLTIAAGGAASPQGTGKSRGFGGGIAALELRDTKIGFEPRSRIMTFAGRELVVTPELAGALGRPKLAGVPIGWAEVSALGYWVGGDVPPPLDTLSWDDGGTASRVIGGDMTFCKIYDLGQWGRVSDIVGLSFATDAWNIGTDVLDWYSSPDPRHPFIVMNLYRLRTVDNAEQFEQIGQSWIKHGYCAADSFSCSGDCDQHNCSVLGVQCADLYGSGLNASQGSLGPRFEVDPWEGDWTYTGSHFQAGGGHDGQIEHRLQVHDADLDPAQNPGATYYMEGYYVCYDDGDVMNSAGWHPVTVSGSPGGSWSFAVDDPWGVPEVGFAVDAWAGAQQTMLAQEVPPIEFVSPDGRCMLAAKVTDLGGGMWHYEYALVNIDMDRQAGSFSIPITPGTLVTNVGFHAVEHHDEPFNTFDADQVAIDNDAWAGAVGYDAVTWSTPANPLRWGTMYNFRFDASAEPEDTTVTLGMFRDGSPSVVTGTTTGPSLGPPDCNGNGIVDNCDMDCGPAGGECDVPGCGGSDDCNGNGVPDECEVDCNGNGVPDNCDTDPSDPDGNGQFSDDCNGNDVPDECELDCNQNGVADSCDVDPADPDGDGQVSDDCQPNGVPDECELVANDCNENQIPDECDIDSGFSEDCNQNDVPDDCEGYPECDPDFCENAIAICAGTYTHTTAGADSDGAASCGAATDSPDVWYSYTPDADGTLEIETCEGSDYDTVLSIHSGCPGTQGNQLACNDDNCPGLKSSLSLEVTGGTTYIIRVSGYNGASGAFALLVAGPECVVDCNNNGVNDIDDIAGGTSEDCNGNGVPDECDLEDGTSQDCDGGPVGVIADGEYLFVMEACAGCHAYDGSGGFGPDIRDYSRVELWDQLLPPTSHFGGDYPYFIQEDFADIEAYLATAGSLGRPDLIPDECQTLVDCDGDGNSDGCELEAGTQVDLDYDGFPDTCLEPIPTVSEWGLIFLGLTMLVTGVIVANRRMPRGTTGRGGP